MTSMIQDVFNSIFEPGVNDGLVKAMNLSFYALFLVLAGMCALTRNIHVFALLGLSIGLYLSLSWFILELKRSEAANQNQVPNSIAPQPVEEEKDKNGHAETDKSK